MKRRFFACVLVVFCSLIVFLLISCDSMSGKTKIAQQNIQQCFEEILRDAGEDDAEIIGYKHSKLYILTPEDESNTIKQEVVTLALDGCSRSNVNTMINNDSIYRELGVMAREYVVVSFADVKSSNDKYSQEIGACFRLSKELNIISVYSVKDKDEDYVYIKLFGQTEGRFYGAVACQYGFLERMYDYYVESLEGDELPITMKFDYVKELNQLFEYDRFEIMDDMEACIDKCLESKDEYEDKKILKDKAYATIKSL